MKTNKLATPRRWWKRPASPEEAFTLVDLLAIVFAVLILLVTLAPAMAKNRVNVKAFECWDNHRQLATAWRQWSADNNDYLLCGQDTTLTGRFDSRLRPVWMTGNLNWSSDPANYDAQQDVQKSPMWPYLPDSTAYKCPSDRTTVSDLHGNRVGRVRSYSMSSAFDYGGWLDGNFTGVSAKWRIYGKGAEIVIPAKTFIFIDEHPGSINDGSFSVACTYNQPNDNPGVAKLVDMPGNYHNGGCTFSYADGSVETHKWQSDYLRILRTDDGYLAPLNISVNNMPYAYLDCRWLAERTTVAK